MNDEREVDDTASTSGGGAFFDQMIGSLQRAPGSVTEAEPPTAPDDSAAEAETPSAEHYGTLDPEARRALVTLLKQGVILGEQKRLLYDAVCRHEEAIRHHLADMFLDLLLDPRAEVAIILQQHEDDEEDIGESFVKLIQRRPMTLYDSLLVIVLRKHYQQRENIGETRVLVEREQIAAQLLPFLPLSNNSAIDQRKLNGALDKLEKHKIVARVRGDSERLEITPVIRYVVDSEFLTQLEKEYRKLSQTDDATTGDAANRTVTAEEKEPDNPPAPEPDPPATRGLFDGDDHARV